MVIHCEGSKAEVLQRLEALSREWRESKIPAATHALGTNHWRLERSGPQQFSVSVHPAGKHPYSLESQVEVIEDSDGTTIRFDLQVSPPLHRAILTLALILVVPALIFRWSLRDFGFMALGGAVLLAIGYVYAMNLEEAGAKGMYALLRLAAKASSMPAPL